MIDESQFINLKNYRNRNIKFIVDKILKEKNYCILKNFYSQKKSINISKNIFKFIKDPRNNLNDSLNPKNFSIKKRDLSKIKSDKKNKKKMVIECFVNFNNKNKDIFNCRELFKMSVDLRNILYGFKKRKKINAIHKKKFITATRFMIYPHNGGFLEKHTDANGAYKTKIFKKYYNIVISLTKINKNFCSGGAFTIINKKKINLEQFLNPGDALIYNEKILHGVDKIICQKKRKQGKISAITNFYNI
jgi:hypothetical protein